MSDAYQQATALIATAGQLIEAAQSLLEAHEAPKPRLAPPRLHTEEEAAAVLRVSPITLKRLRQRRQIQHIAWNGIHVRYTDDQLSDFLAAHTVSDERQAS